MLIGITSVIFSDNISQQATYLRSQLTYAEENDEVEEEDDFVICRSHLGHLNALFLLRTGNKGERRRNTARESRL